MMLSREQEGCVSTTKHSLAHTKCHTDPLFNQRKPLASDWAYLVH